MYVIRSRPERHRVGRRGRRRQARRDLVVVGVGQAEAAGRAGQPVEVAGQRERQAVDHLRPSRRRRRRRSARGRTPRRGRLGRPAARRRPRSSLSSPSRSPRTVPTLPRAAGRPSARSRPTPRSGSDPQVMPAPVPKRSMPSAPVDPERADADGQLAGPRSASTQPTPRSTGRAAPVSSASMIRSALDLGAPVTEPGGKVAPSSSGQPTPARSSPRTVDTRCTRPGCCSTRAQVGHGHRAGRADPPEVVADQVDDHHVLGAVLVQQVRRGAAGALDRAGLDGPAVAAQEQLRRRGDDLDAVRGQADRAGVRRRVAGASSGGQRVHVGVGRSAAARTAPGRGSPGRRRRPRCARGCAAHRAVYAARSSDDDQSPAAGPAPRAPAPARAPAAWRTSPNRAQVRRPSKSTTTAQQPAESRAAGSSVTSRSRWREAAEAGQRSEVAHAAESMAGWPRGLPWRMSSSGHSAARCTNAFLCWPGNPLEFNTSPGRAERDRKRHADVAQLVEHHLAKVRVASSNLVVRSEEVGDLPEPLHSWWSGREARQRPAKPSTRVQIPSPPPRTISSAGERFPDTEEVTGSIPVSSTGPQGPDPQDPRAISSAGERFPDTEEVTGSIPVSRTQYQQQRTRHPRTISSAGERFPDTEEVTGSIPVSSTAEKPPAVSYGRGLSAAVSGRSARRTACGRSSCGAWPW